MKEWTLTQTGIGPVQRKRPLGEVAFAAVQLDNLFLDGRLRHQARCPCGNADRLVVALILRQARIDESPALPCPEHRT